MITEFFYKYKDLINKIINTVGMISIYRIGCHVNLPGINSNILKNIVYKDGGGFLSNLDLFAGGSIAKGTIFALGVYPYISASLLIQFLTSEVGLPYFINLKKQSGTGQEQLNAYTKYFTLIIALFHSVGYCTYIVTQKYEGFSAVYLSKPFFFFIAIIHMLAGLMFLIWLGNQITKKGICNGISLIIFTGIISNVPKSIIKSFNLLNTNMITPGGLLLFFLFVIIVMLFALFTETSKRNISVRYPHSKLFESTSVVNNHVLPLKINNASIMPSVMAAAVLMAPTFISNIFSKLNLQGPKIDHFFMLFNRGEPLYFIIYGISIVFFTIVYTPMVFAPTTLSDPLKKSGCVLENWRPGNQTSFKLSSIIENLSYIAAVKLLILCVGVEFVLTKTGAPFVLSGTAIMIACSVALEIYDSYRAHSSSHESLKVIDEFPLGKIYNFLFIKNHN
jgi:preprotein translocase subunit SecY